MQIKEIMKMSIPLMVQGLVFQMQSLTDKAFLGNLDTKYVSAIGSASMPFNACMDSFAAISTGLIILVSMCYGAKQFEELKSYVKSTAFYNGLLGVCLFVMWQLFAGPLLHILQVEDSISQYGAAYIRICAVYLLFAGLDGTFQAMLQGMGKTKVIMYAGIIKVVINILISWVLIFGKFGFPEMNVIGASLFMVMPENILSIFSNDNDVIRQGVLYLIGIGFILFPQSLNTVCGGAIRANGNTRWMLNTQMIGSILVLCLSFVLVKVIHMEMIAVYITLFVDETVHGLLNLVYYRVKYGYKKEADLLGD